MKGAGSGRLGDQGGIESGEIGPVLLGVQRSGIQGVRGGTRRLLGSPSGVRIGVRHRSRRRPPAGAGGLDGLRLDDLRLDAPSAARRPARRRATVDAGLAGDGSMPGRAARAERRRHPGSSGHSAVGRSSSGRIPARAASNAPQCTPDAPPMHPDGAQLGRIGERVPGSSAAASRSAGCSARKWTAATSCRWSSSGRTSTAARAARRSPDRQALGKLAMTPKPAASRSADCSGRTAAGYGQLWPGRGQSSSGRAPSVDGFRCAPMHPDGAQLARSGQRAPGSSAAASRSAGCSGRKWTAATSCRWSS